MNSSKLILSLSLLALTISFGTFGYFLYEDMSLFDAFYMTLITISTVGFSEIKPLSVVGRGITLVIIVMGISLLTYSLGQIASIFIEGELRRILGRKKLEKHIAELKNHYIICGYGRIGQVIVRELLAENIPLVIIDQNKERTKELEEQHLLYLNMDATSDDALLTAGLKKARGLVTAVSSDADNVFIALSAKELHPDIFILARASDVQNEKKLIRAGASRVVCPYQMGGRRMAEILHKPTVVDFIDQAMMHNDLDLELGEMKIPKNSPIDGKTVLNSNLRQDYGIIIIAIKRAHGEMLFNPGPHEEFRSGDVIVIIGKQEQLQKMTKDIG